MVKYQSRDVGRKGLAPFESSISLLPRVARKTTRFPYPKIESAS
jgi:hypothetical protein